MKLLTLNCHAWIEENQMEKIRTLAKTIAEKEYDVIALQEVNQSIKEETAYGLIKRDNYAVVLLDELKKIGVEGYELHWGQSHIGYEKYEEGSALLSKYPIKETHSFLITNSTDPGYWKTRRIVGVTAEADGELISFYSCHLGWWDDAEEPFKEQAVSLLRQVHQEQRFFLMGDFNNNAHIRGEGFDYLMSQGLLDTYELAEEKDRGITVPGKIAGWEENEDPLRIDLILTNQPLKVRHSAVIFNGENKAVVSDHFGVEIEAVLK
ncbi:endonuclease [Bacillus sp. FJAT-42376]|uniref:endonuclease/exonuclease/phosphatase family protein n=1 Tax=Bacillus sp. FJAT-42376 TaxID=2014076 RepID=UPI000F4DFF3E|nr:endonuclease/exonuclease/phosphatase family protein [Bacillus sp. FJAT-42376]AZB40985.1 endonuclease [Bacillus sp. FJAT-42376]